MVTIFDGDAPVPVEPEQSWRRIAMPRLRRRENTAALTILGVESVSLGLVDAALRRTENGYAYAGPDELFGPAADGDTALGKQIAGLLERWCADAAAINAPLAIGGHVDHRLVPDAMARWEAGTIEWYEDFPYAEAQPGSSPLIKGLCPRWHAVDPDAWIDAAAVYRSQARILFGGTDMLAARLRAHATRRGVEAGLSYAERCWVTASK